nr:Chain P, residue synthetic peptide [synthetic construct]
VNDIFERI